MRRVRGSPLQAARNLFAPGVPLGRRAILALRNGMRRLGPPPRDCCDHPGEPGC